MKIFAKKSLCVALVLCLLMSIAPMVVQAADEPSHNGLEKVYAVYTERTVIPAENPDEKPKVLKTGYPMYDYSEGTLALAPYDPDNPDDRTALAEWDAEDQEVADRTQSVTGFGDNGREVIGFYNVDLGSEPVNYIKLRVRIPTQNLYIKAEVWIDAPTAAEGGTLVSTIDTGVKTSMWNGGFFDEYGTVPGLTGVHDVYIASSNALSFNYFKFEKEARNPYRKIEAETSAERYGGDIPYRVEGSGEIGLGWWGGGGKGQNFGLTYKNFDFKYGLKEIKIYVNTWGNYGTDLPTYSVRSGGFNGREIGSFTATDTVNQWRTITIPITEGISGVHDITLCSDKGSMLEWFEPVQLFAEPETDAELGEFTAEGGVVSITADVHRSWLSDSKYDLASLLLIAYDADGNMLDMESKVIRMVEDIVLDPSVAYGTLEVTGSITVPEGATKVVAVVVDHLLSGNFITSKTYNVQ